MNFKRYIVLLAMFIGSTLFAEINTDKIITDIQIKGLSTLPQRDLPNVSHFRNKVGQRVREDYLQQDLDKLFLTGHFESVSAETSTHNQGVMLTFTVIENHPINEIIITGNRDIKAWKLLNELNSKPKAALNLKTLLTDKGLLETYYITRGYTLAEVDTIELNPSQNLIITLSEGSIGKVSFSGLEKTKSFAVERELRLQPGRSFNTLKLRQDRERLVRLGYFSYVSVPTLETDENQEKLIHVHYRLKERKLNIVDFGLEQREDAIVTFLRGNIYHVLTHTDSLTAKIQAEPNINDRYLIRSYSLRYHQPWFLNRYRVNFTVLGWTEFNQEFLTSDLQRSDLYRTQRSGVSVGFGFPLFYDRLLLSTRVKHENVQTEPGTSPTSEPYQVQSVIGGLSYTRLDNLFNPSSGGYWAINMEKGGNLGLAKLDGLSFTRLSVNTAGFIPVTERGVFAVRGFVGSFDPDSSLVDTFDAEGFVLGGANSLRGYKEFDNPFVGNRQVLANLEYRYQVTNLFQGVLFYDIGRAFNTGFDLSYSEMEYGYGIGVRVITPLAPIRFDFAWGQDFLIQFGLGQMF